LIRIVHVITELNVGGAETMLFKLVSNMDRNKFDIKVVSLIDIGPIGLKIKEIGVPVIALGMKRGFFNPIMLFKLIKLLKKNKTDLVQTWMYHSDFVGGLASCFAGNIPVVWNIRHSNLDLKFNKISTICIAKICSMLSSWLPQKIICCSYASKSVHSCLGYDDSKMVVIPNGFDTDTFCPNENARIKMREELNLANDTYLLGLVGRYDTQKDHQNFFNAVGLLHGKYPEVNFVLCGDGITNDNQFLNKLIDKEGVRSVTHLLGRRDDMPLLQASFDVAVSSSCGEGFSNALGEAMACNVPCVVTDVGDSAIIVGDTGFVVPSRDSQTLAKALEKMIETRKDRKRNISTIRQRIVENFSLGKIVCSYQTLYRNLIKY